MIENNSRKTTHFSDVNSHQVEQYGLNRYIREQETAQEQVARLFADFNEVTEIARGRIRARILSNTIGNDEDADLKASYWILFEKALYEAEMAMIAFSNFDEDLLKADGVLPTDVTKEEAVDKLWDEYQEHLGLDEDE